MEIRGEPGDPFVFPAKCGLPAFQPLCIRFFFYLSKCDNFSGTGKLVRFFFFLFTRRIVATIIYSRLFWIKFDGIRIWNVWRMEKEREGWIIVVKNNLEN